MRKGEINALKWSDIDGNIIHVRRSVSQKIKGKSILETPPKNKSSYRDLQMPQPLIDILSEHKERQQAYYEENFTECVAELIALLIQAWISITDAMLNWQNYHI